MSMLLEATCSSNTSGPYMIINTGVNKRVIAEPIFLPIEAGKYTSQAGWDTKNTTATGDVKFGIQAKYQNGNTPTGHTKFTFNAGNIDFASISYQWLVVSG